MFLVATGSDDKYIRIFDWTTGSLLYTYTQQKFEVSALKRLPNYQLAVGLVDGTFSIIHLVNNTIRATISKLNSKDGGISSFVLLNNETLAVCHSSFHVRIWNLNNLVMKIEFGEFSYSFLSFEYINSKNAIAIGQYNGYLTIWDIKNGQKIETLYHGNYVSVNSLLMLTNDRLASGDSVNNIIIWNVENWSKIKTIQPGASKMILIHNNFIGYINSNSFYLYDLNQINITSISIANKTTSISGLNYDTLKLINRQVIAVSVSNTMINYVNLYNLSNSNYFSLTGWFGDKIKTLELIELCPGRFNFFTYFLLF